MSSASSLALLGPVECNPAGDGPRHKNVPWRRRSDKIRAGTSRGKRRIGCLVDSDDSDKRIVGLVTTTNRAWS
jgi:hypothetical protein